MKKSELWLIEKGQSEEDLSLDHIDELLKEVESEREKSERLIKEIRSIADRVSCTMSELSEIGSEDSEINQKIDYRTQDLKELYLSIQEALEGIEENY